MSATAVDGHGELVEQLDQQVREAVRREGVDPQRDAPVVRRIAEGVVRDHDERSLTGAVAPVPDAAAVVGELVARVSGFGPLQPFLDDPAVEEVWINDPTPGVRRPPRPARADQPDPDPRPGPRAGRADAQVQRPAHRPVSQPFVDAMLPEGHRLHVVLEGISRGFSAVNIRKFVLKAARLADLVELGTPDRRRPRRSSRRRSGPGSTSWSPAAPRPARPRCSTAWPPRSPAATGWSRPRRSSSSGSRTPTGCRCRPGRPGSRAPARSAARPGQGEPADAAEPDHRRRGPGRGVPRPAARAQRRAAGHVHAARQQRARGAGEDVHAAAARGREHLRPVRRPDRGRARSTWSSTSASTTQGVRRVNEIVAVPGRVENDIIETEPIFERQRRRAASPPAACRRGSSAFQRARHRRPPASSREAG